MPEDDEIEQLEGDISIAEPGIANLAGMTREEQYFQLITTALQACSQYKPMFGKGRKCGYC